MKYPQEHVNNLLRTLSKSVTFLDLQLSQCSVATYCRWGGNLYGLYIENILRWKSFENRSTFAKVINKHQAACFFETRYVINAKCYYFRTYYLHHSGWLLYLHGWHVFCGCFAATTETTFCCTRYAYSKFVFVICYYWYLTNIQTNRRL